MIDAFSMLPLKLHQKNPLPTGSLLNVPYGSAQLPMLFFDNSLPISLENGINLRFVSDRLQLGFMLSSGLDIRHVSISPLKLKLDRFAHPYWLSSIKWLLIMLYLHIYSHLLLWFYWKKELKLTIILKIVHSFFLKWVSIL